MLTPDLDFFKNFASGGISTISFDESQKTFHQYFAFYDLG